MDRVDLDKLATIIESPEVTEARRRRFAELFSTPVEPVWPDSALLGRQLELVELSGLTAANVTIGPWGNAGDQRADG